MESACVRHACDLHPLNVCKQCRSVSKCTSMQLYVAVHVIFAILGMEVRYE